MLGLAKSDAQQRQRAPTIKGYFLRRLLGVGRKILGKDQPPAVRSGVGNHSIKATRHVSLASHPSVPTQATTQQHVTFFSPGDVDYDYDIDAPTVAPAPVP